MFRELLSLLRPTDPLGAMGEDFTKMLRRSRDLLLQAGEIYFGRPPEPEELAKISKRDVKVNKLQRKIRKRVIMHLSVAGNSMDLPYCLVLMSLVKDAERIGDYAKELCEIRPLAPGSALEGEVMKELEGVRRLVEQGLDAAADVFANSDREKAIGLIHEGRELVERCQALLQAVTGESSDAGTLTVLVLGIQYYRRIAGHVLNILSSIVVPLHRLDYYDDKDMLPEGTG